MSHLVDKEMSLLEHLGELRKMIMRSVLGIIIFGIVAVFIKDFIFDSVIFGPKKANFISYQWFCQVGMDSFCAKVLPFSLENRTMDGQFSVMMWTCITAGFIMSFPWILYQLWLFISPALYQNERKYAVWFIIVSSILFFLGVLFGYFILLPLSLDFLSGISVSDEIKNDIDVKSYIGMVKTTSLATGLIFELPVVIFFLAKLGLVSDLFLKEYRKYAIILILILAAIITPPDFISQIIVAIPMLILYEISIFIAKFVQPKQKV